MKRLEGKSALVTGAASGIGRASSLLFAQHGASVVVVDRASEVEATAEAIRAAGGRAVAVVADVSKEADVEAFIQTAVREHGGLDVCYANAGISGGLVPFDELTVELWERVLGINLIGAFLTVKYAARVMVPKGRGSIICTRLITPALLAL